MRPVTIGTLVERVLAMGSLVCPDDGGRLTLVDGSLRCDACGRHFSVHSTGVIELLPTAPVPLHDAAPVSYVQSYLAEFERPFAEIPDAVGWGAPERIPASIAARRVQQSEWVTSLLAVTHGSDAARVFADVSGGSGYYTFAARHRFDVVLHCDLSVDSLNYANRRAGALGVENMLFLRTDYFRLPFRRSLDRIVCCDTLFGGVRHEHLLLTSIHNALRPDGVAVVDFHNWWHNPLRRIGLLPQNFGENRSYSRRESERVLLEAGIGDFEYFPYHQELGDRGVLRSLLSRIIPPTRLTYRVTGTRRDHI